MIKIHNLEDEDSLWYVWLIVMLVLLLIFYALFGIRFYFKVRKLKADGLWKPMIE